MYGLDVTFGNVERFPASPRVLGDEGSLDRRMLGAKRIGEWQPMGIALTKILVQIMIRVDRRHSIDALSGFHGKRVVGSGHARETGLTTLRRRFHAQDTRAERLRNAKGIVTVPQERGRISASEKRVVPAISS